MDKNFFEQIGKELDSIVNEFKTTLEEEFSEDKLKKKKDIVKEVFKEMETDLTTIFKDMNKEVDSFFNNQKTKKSKFKKFNIKIVDFKKTIIKYDKKNNKIIIEKKGSDRTYDIQLVKDISKKKITKILETVSYNDEDEILSITVKKKYLA